MDRELVVEFARVTEAAAINCAHWIGRGRKNDADGAAVEAMRKMFDTVKISGTVVIGEGEMDEAPMLYIGEENIKALNDDIRTFLRGEDPSKAVSKS